jgi:glycosyltransferase involved in cell wall biosynthesis
LRSGNLAVLGKLNPCDRSSNDVVGAAERMKVLHVVATIGRGGVETWLDNLLSHFDVTKFQFDVCFYRKAGDDLKESLLSSRCSVFELALQDDLSGLTFFIRRLRELIRCGNYQAVHCHGMSFVGVPIYCAWRERVPIRIAHSHGTSEPKRPISQRTFLGLARYAALQLATHRIGCSTEAAEALFGRGCLGRSACLVYCGVDLDKYPPVVLPELKESLGISPSATVIGCIANFTPAKNHRFLLSVFTRILQHEPTAHLILVGEGKNRVDIENHTISLGIKDRVHLLGRRNDVPTLLSIFDVFVLPSLTEGLPVALLEAQAHGVPCLTSSAVTREVEVIPGLVKFLSLTADLDVWSRAAIALIRATSQRNSQHSRRIFKRSPYNIDCGVSQLSEIYLSHETIS